MGYGFRALLFSELAHREEPPVLLCEGLPAASLAPVVITACLG